MADGETTIESLRTTAAQAGLSLTDEELGQMQQGINRTRAMAQALRALLRDDLEPAPVFRAAPSEKEGRG